MYRSIVVLLSLVLCTLTVSAARAESRVVVRPFYGPHADSVREAVERSLDKRASVVVISSKEADQSARKLRVDANSPEGRRAVARQMQVSAWVEGIVQKHGSKLRVTVLVYDGANHDRVGRAVFVGKNSKAMLAAIRQSFWSDSKKAITQASAPPAQAPAEDSTSPTAVASAEETAEPEPAREEALASAAPSTDRSWDDSESEATSESVRSTSTSTTFLPAFTPTVESAEAPRNDAADEPVEAGDEPTTLIAALSLGSPFRKLAYNDPFTQNLGDYQLAGAPMVDARLAYFPGSKFTRGWGSYIGLDLRGQLALGMRTVDTEGNEFKSRYDALHAGVLARVPVSKHYVYGFSGYAMQRFTLESQTNGVSSPTPNVDYRMVRSGAGAELALAEKLTMGVDAAYLYMLSVGDIGNANWFPRTKAGGFEAAVFAAYALSDKLFARAFMGYQRVFFDFQSQNDDPVIAGGAADTYLTAGLGAGVRL